VATRAARRPRAPLVIAGRTPAGIAVAFCYHHRGTRARSPIAFAHAHAAGGPMHLLLAALLVVSASPTPGSTTQDYRPIPADYRVHDVTLVAKTRQVLVWLPPGYATGPERRYPTLYMHDGATVFVEWRIDEVAKRLIASGAIQPLIIVLVPNGGEQADRFNDYTPTRPSNARAGGGADAYGRALVEELKPLIDAKYRTLPDAANTALGGASLGGLVSLHLGLKHPDVFGKLAVLSPSVWWDERVIVRTVKAVAPRPPLRIWLDMGTRESRNAIADARELRDALKKKGWRVGEDLAYSEIQDAAHNDEAFARRAEPFLKYLFPPPSASGS
jgi:predicted alpha/beta superfamily hydrolase